MQCLVDDVVPVERCQDDYRRLFLIASSYFPSYFEAVHFRHFPVKKHEVVRFVLGVLHFQHLQRRLPVVARVGLDADLVQHDPRMLRRDFLVVHDQNPHVVRVDIAHGKPLVLAVGQRDDDGKLRPDAFFRFDGDRAVHQLYDALRDRHSEAGAAVLVVPAAILLCERVEQLRQERLVDADSGVLYAEFQS